jgi:hypothetical protein
MEEGQRIALRRPPVFARENARVQQIERQLRRRPFSLDDSVLCRNRFSVAEL